jgi:hypothetical protein
MRLRLFTVLLLASLASLASFAADTPPPAGEAQSLEVTAVKHPEQRRYRNFLDGMEAFEKHHALAPNAELRFRIVPYSGTKADRDLSLEIGLDSGRLDIALGPDLTFAIPRNDAWSDENPPVRLNRQDSSFVWFADIRSSGLPAGTRRLGDLRLECEVLMATGLRQFVLSPVGWALKQQTDLCASKAFPFHFAADRPFFNVTLQADGKEQVLYSKELYGSSFPALKVLSELGHIRDRIYLLPIWNSAWPDDTLVRFEDLAIPVDQPSSP